VCIGVNTIALATETYPPNRNQEIAVEYANLVFYTIFMVEMILKLFGFGLYSYFRDTLNLFDFIIIVLSTFDLGLFIY
jgi:voltage-dependent calcium channel R type alpha-1E